MATNSQSTTRVWTAAGGPGRAGLFPGPVRLAPKPTRRLVALGAMQASVVFDEQDRVFVADMAGWVQAFTQEGGLVWQRQLAGGVSASPAVDVEGGRVFIGTHAGWVYALQTADGAVLWRRSLPTKGDARILSDLLYLPAQQSVVLSSWGGQFHALDTASGETKHTWDAGLWPQVGASADVQGNLYCLRTRRGEGVAFFRVSPDGKETVLHNQPESRRGAQRMAVAAAPVLDEARGVVYFITNGDRDCEVHAWLLQEQRHLWKRGLPRTVMATPALGPTGNLLLADMEGSIHALAPDGASVFRYLSGADYLLAGPVCAADGHAFAGDPLGRLHAVDSTGEGGPVFEAARAIQARPAFDRRGNLYVPSTDRTIYVFRNLASG